MRKAIWLVLVAAASAFAYTVTVDTGDVNIKPTEDPAFLGYDVVTLAGGGVIPAAPGEPALPGVTVTVSIPRGMEIESVDVSTGDPVELPGTYRVMPIQEPTAFSASAATPTPANDKVYSSAEAFPGKLAYSFGSGNMGGYGVGSICLAPVQYVPATGKVLLYPILDFDVKLRPAEGELVYPAVRLEWMDRQVREALAAQVINPWEVAPATGVRLLDGGDSLDGPPYPYLIITNSAMATAAQELADWKTKKGLNATVVTTEDIESGYTGVDTAEKIRNCIKEYFTQYGTEYVCLIGTNSIIPVRKVYDPQYNVAEGDNLVPTDNYYGCLDGSFNEDGDGYWGEYNDDNVDWVYDVYVGRLHVATEAELVEVIDKTLCYEGTELSTEVNPYDYQDEMILAGGWADSSTNLKLMMEYIRDNYLTSSHWSFTELWDDTYPGGTVFNGTNFTAEMNGGRGLVAHMAHCNTTTLGTNSGGVSSSTLLGLSNHPEFMGFLYSVGCYASNTDHDNNCGAYFVAAPDGAGVGFCCNTRYGWYSRGDPLNHYSQEFFKEYFRQFAVEDVYVAGQLNAFHKHALQSYLSAYIYRYIYFELIHTGDPELWVPNGAIGALTVGFDDQIPVASQTYDVHVADAMNADVEGALVCLWKGEEVYASDLTSSSGDVSFSIEPTTTGYMYLTVSGHNCETFEADVGVGTTGVELTSFEGRRVESGIVLNWTVSEGAGVESYNLYRRPVNALAAPTGGGATANAMAGAFGSNGATAAAPTNDG
ncbi:MAG: C25 family cysteine peptidase, partial [Candidatus Zixiibacteriota bacterium]